MSSSGSGGARKSGEDVEMSEPSTTPSTSSTSSTQLVPPQTLTNTRAPGAQTPAVKHPGHGGDASGGERKRRAACVTPLMGSGAGGNAGRSCVLQLGNVRVLVDCGWDTRFRESQLEALKKAVTTAEEPINLILLSYPDIEHLGALPVVVGRLGVKVPIFCTLPVFYMGRMALKEALASRLQEGEFTAFTAEDVDAAFQLTEDPGVGVGVRPLKFSEQLVIPGYGITITPYNAGHTLGGALWRIQWHTEEILYAADMNHQSEKHLSGAALSHLPQPSLVITDATNWGRTLAPQSSRQAELQKVVLSTLQGGGNVLMPTDASSRALELLLILDRLWQEKNLHHRYRIVFLHPMAVGVLDYARAMIEWMNDDISCGFDPSLSRDSAVHPFQLRNVHACASLEEFDQLAESANSRHFSRGQQPPTVVLATGSTLEYGPARALAQRWGTSRKHRIVFTQRAHAESLAHRLQTSNSRPLEVTLRVSSKLALEGEELVEHEQMKEHAELEKRRAHDRERFIQEINQGISTTEFEGDPAATTSGTAPETSPPSEKTGATGSTIAATPTKGSSPQKAQGPGPEGAADTDANADDAMATDADPPPVPTTPSSITGAVKGDPSSPDTTTSSSTPIHSGTAAASLVLGRNSATMARKSASGMPAPPAKRLKKSPSTVVSLEDYATPHYPMFGALDPPTRVSAYGAPIPADVLSVFRHISRSNLGRLGRGSGDELGLRGGVGRSIGGSGGHGGGSGGATANAKADDEERPFKFVTETRTVRIRCQTPLIDMEGRSNGESIMNTLMTLAPQRLVVAYGPPGPSEAMRKHFDSSGSSSSSNNNNTALAPGIGEGATLLFDNRSFDLLLSDKLMASLTFEAVGSYEVAFVSGKLCRPPASAAVRAMLEPQREEAAVQGHPPVWLTNDIKILTLKKVLAERGIKCDMRGAGGKQHLICYDGSASRAVQVLIRYSAATRSFQMEGALCPTYFAVRNIIYDRLTLC